MKTLFSTFDPLVLWLNIRGNWARGLIVIFWIPGVFWLFKAQPLFAWKVILISLAKELKLNFRFVPTPGHTHWALRLFSIILLNNLRGLTSYTFTASRHLSFSVRLALGGWLAYITYGLVLNCGRTLAHLVPVGTPCVLIPFIVLIELIRNLIRPLTLSVRLVANLVAGHLLITLTSSPLASLSLRVVIVLIVGLTLLLILERAVALIQAYVFRTLRTLYLREINSLKFNYLCNLKISLMI